MPRLTSKGQVTVPVAVRYALGLAPGDDVVFAVQGDRGVSFISSHATMDMDHMVTLRKLLNTVDDDAARTCFDHLRQIVQFDAADAEDRDAHGGVDARDVFKADGGTAVPPQASGAWRLESPMHDQGTHTPAQPRAGLPTKDVAALHELRAGIAEVEKRIDRLMVMRRRELAGSAAGRGVTAARSRRGVRAARRSAAA